GADAQQLTPQQALNVAQQLHVTGLPMAQALPIALELGHLRLGLDAQEQEGQDMQLPTLQELGAMPNIGTLQPVVETSQRAQSTASALEQAKIQAKRGETPEVRQQAKRIVPFLEQRLKNAQQALAYRLSLPIVTPTSIAVQGMRERQQQSLSKNFAQLTRIPTMSPLTPLVAAQAMTEQGLDARLLRLYGPLANSLQSLQQNIQQARITAATGGWFRRDLAAWRFNRSLTSAYNEMTATPLSRLLPLAGTSTSAPATIHHLAAPFALGLQAEQEEQFKEVIGVIHAHAAIAQAKPTTIQRIASAVRSDVPLAPLMLVRDLAMEGASVVQPLFSQAQRTRLAAQDLEDKVEGVQEEPTPVKDTPAQSIEQRVEEVRQAITSADLREQLDANQEPVLVDMTRTRLLAQLERANVSRQLEQAETQAMQMLEGLPKELQEQVQIENYLEPALHRVIDDSHLSAREKLAQKHAISEQFKELEKEQARMAAQAKAESEQRERIAETFEQGTVQKELWDVIAQALPEDKDRMALTRALRGVHPEHFVEGLEPGTDGIYRSKNRPVELQVVDSAEVNAQEQVFDATRPLAERDLVREGTVVKGVNGKAFVVRQRAEEITKPGRRQKKAIGALRDSLERLGVSVRPDQNPQYSSVVLKDGSLGVVVGNPAALERNGSVDRLLTPLDRSEAPTVTLEFSLGKHESDDVLWIGNNGTKRFLPQALAERLGGAQVRLPGAAQDTDVLHWIHKVGDKLVITERAKRDGHEVPVAVLDGLTNEPKMFSLPLRGMINTPAVEATASGDSEDLTPDADDNNPALETFRQSIINAFIPGLSKEQIEAERKRLLDAIDAFSLSDADKLKADLIDEVNAEADDALLEISTPAQREGDVATAGDPIQAATEKGYSEDPISHGYWKISEASHYPVHPLAAFKVHVAMTEENAATVLAEVLPELQARGISHKVIANLDNLRDLNSGSDTQVGKTITLYFHVTQPGELAVKEQEALAVAKVLDAKLRGKGLMPPAGFLKAKGSRSDDAVPDTESGLLGWRFEQYVSDKELGIDSTSVGFNESLTRQQAQDFVEGMLARREGQIVPLESLEALSLPIRDILKGMVGEHNYREPTIISLPRSAMPNREDALKARTEDGRLIIVIAQDILQASQLTLLERIAHEVIEDRAEQMTTDAHEIAILAAERAGIERDVRQTKAQEKQRARKDQSRPDMTVPAAAQVLPGSNSFIGSFPSLRAFLALGKAYVQATAQRNLSATADSLNTTKPQEAGLFINGPSTGRTVGLPANTVVRDGSGKTDGKIDNAQETSKDDRAAKGAADISIDNGGQSDTASDSEEGARTVSMGNANGSGGAGKDTNGGSRVELPKVIRLLINRVVNFVRPKAQEYKFTSGLAPPVSSRKLQAASYKPAKISSSILSSILSLPIYTIGLVIKPLYRVLSSVAGRSLKAAFNVFKSSLRAKVASPTSPFLARGLLKTIIHSISDPFLSVAGRERRLPWIHRVWSFVTSWSTRKGSFLSQQGAMTTEFSTSLSTPAQESFWNRSITTLRGSLANARLTSQLVWNAITAFFQPTKSTRSNLVERARGRVIFTNDEGRMMRDEREGVRGGAASSAAQRVQGVTRRNFPRSAGALPFVFSFTGASQSVSTENDGSKSDLDAAIEVLKSPNADLAAERNAVRVIWDALLDAKDLEARSISIGPEVSRVQRLIRILIDFIKEQKGVVFGSEYSRNKAQQDAMRRLAQAAANWSQYALEGITEIAPFYRSFVLETRAFETIKDVARIASQKINQPAAQAATEILKEINLSKEEILRMARADKMWIPALRDVFYRELFSDEEYTEEVQEVLSTILYPERFDRNGLREIVKNRANNKSDDRPIAVVIYPASDDNGYFALTKDLFSDLIAHGYRVIYFEVATKEELYQALDVATTQARAQVLIFGGHGHPTVMRLGVSRDEDINSNNLKYTLRTDDVKDSMGDYLEKDGVVILNSCNTGRDGRTKEGLLTRFKKVFSHARIVVGPTDDILGVKIIFNDETSSEIKDVDINIDLYDRTFEEGLNDLFDTRKNTPIEVPDPFQASSSSPNAHSDMNDMISGRVIFTNDEGRMMRDEREGVRGVKPRGGNATLRGWIILPEGTNLAFSHNLPMQGEGNILGRAIAWAFNHKAHRRDGRLNWWGRLVKATVEGLRVSLSSDSRRALHQLRRAYASDREEVEGYMAAASTLEGSREKAIARVRRTAEELSQLRSELSRAASQERAEQIKEDIARLIARRDKAVEAIRRLNVELAQLHANNPSQDTWARYSISSTFYGWLRATLHKYSRWPSAQEM
ncbi:MAG: hypothetical protein PHV55_05255, partial [Candidatus Omnitrophica bacterium]|nr:hypothetical protein [Candidatus Omnitrophota bacterium]